MTSIRPRPVLFVLSLVIGLAACGGGGPHDLNLTASPPVTVTTPPSTSSTTTTSVPSVSLPAYSSQVAQASVSNLPVYSTPDAHSQSRSFADPQVFLVRVRRPDGWLKVVLPIRPAGRTGWVRAADVKVSEVDYRIQIALRAKRLTVFGRGRVIYRGRIVVGASAPLTPPPTPPGRYYLRRLLIGPKSRTMSSPYVYTLINKLAVLLPLGTPVDVTR